MQKESKVVVGRPPHMRYSDIMRRVLQHRANGNWKGP